MKVLVTGGMGYLGSVLTGELLQQGFSVKILDSMTYGHTADWISKELSIIRKDIRDDASVQKALDDVDAVVHLAAIVGDGATDLDKEDSIKVNYDATRQLAIRCKDGGIKLVFASTCAVYAANPDTLLLNEGAEAYPLSLYAASKLAAEEAIKKHNGKRSTIFRLGTLFGYSPRMRFDLVVNRFVGQAMQEGKISVFGGSQYRPFIHVQDAAKAFITATARPETGIFNLGGVNYRILDIAKVVERKTGCQLTIRELSDPRSYMVDSSLAQKTFNARFAISIDSAIDEIKGRFACGLIKDYRLSTYDNERRLIETHPGLPRLSPPADSARSQNSYKTIIGYATQESSREED
jgi:nucleoside-diphosphate-sugar epimerase